MASTTTRRSKLTHAVAGMKCRTWDSGARSSFWTMSLCNNPGGCRGRRQAPLGSGCAGMKHTAHGTKGLRAPQLGGAVVACLFDIRRLRPLPSQQCHPIERERPAGAGRFRGGPEGTRTPDLCIANASLYQLSYRPIACGKVLLPATRATGDFPPPDSG